MTLSTFEREAEPRTDAGKGASRRLRRANRVPGIVYGAGKAPAMISLAQNILFRHLENEAFYSHVLTLKVGDGPVERVVLKDLQRHPAKPILLHVDFQRISDDEKLRMSVPLHFVNEEASPGLQRGGQVSHALTEVDILCYPKDLPEYIDVDLSGLEIGNSLHLSDLVLPEGVELAYVTDSEATVVSIHGKAAAEPGDEEEGEGGEEAAE